MWKIRLLGLQVEWKRIRRYATKKISYTILCTETVENETYTLEQLHTAHTLEERNIWRNITSLTQPQRKGTARKQSPVSNGHLMNLPLRPYIGADKRRNRYWEDFTGETYEHTQWMELFVNSSVHSTKKNNFYLYSNAKIMQNYDPMD